MKSANEIKLSCFPIAEEYFSVVLLFFFSWGGEGNKFGLVTSSGFVHRLTENVRFVPDSSAAFVIYGQLFGTWILEKTL